MIGVANITPHGQAVQMAAKVILQRRSRQLLAVIDVFRSDKAHYRVHQVRGEMPRQSVAPAFHSHLVSAVVAGGGGQLAALPGFKI